MRNARKQEVFVPITGNPYIEAMNRTSIGAVSEAARDAVADYRDENELSNYDEAVRQLLRDAGVAGEYLSERVE